MKTRVSSLILSFLIAVPHASAAPSCEDVFVTREERTQKIVTNALEDAHEVFNLSEKHLEKIRARIQKVMANETPSEQLRLAKILKAVDTVLESRWLSWKEILTLDGEALTRRIIVQEKVLADLRKDLEATSEFHAADPNLILKTRIQAAKSPNFRRAVGNLAVNTAYYVGMIKLAGLTPVFPANVPLVRVRLPLKAIERYNQLRDDDIPVAEAADVVKQEFPDAVYGQASLKWALVIFGAVSTAYTLSVVWEDRDKEMAYLVPFSHEVLQQAMKAGGALRDAAKLFIERMKTHLKERLTKETVGSRRKELEDQLKRLDEDLLRIMNEPSET